jgi:hypothetical protein
MTLSTTLKEFQRRWAKTALTVIGIVGFVLLFTLTRGCGIEALGQWTEKPSVEPSPSARYWEALAYDEKSDKVIMFGGVYSATSSDDVTLRGDTWTYDLATGTWKEVTPAGESPSARSDHVMLYEPTSGTVLMFGGHDATTPNAAGLGDLWEFDPAAGTWTELEPAGTGPSDWEYETAVYDSKSRQVLLVGSKTEYPSAADTTRYRFVNEIWSYDPAANEWTELEPSGIKPPGLMREAAAYNAATGTVLVYGGAYTSLDGPKPEDDFDGAIPNQSLWAYDPVANTWSDLEPQGSSPPAAGGPYLGYYAGIDRYVYLAQGQTDSGDIASAMGAYDPAANRWTQIKPAEGDALAARLFSATVWCSEKWGVLLYGGFRIDEEANTSDDTVAFVYPSSVWIYAVPAQSDAAP